MVKNHIFHYLQFYNYKAKLNKCHTQLFKIQRFLSDKAGAHKKSEQQISSKGCFQISYQNRLVNDTS